MTLEETTPTVVLFITFTITNISYTTPKDFFLKLQSLFHYPTIE